MKYLKTAIKKFFPKDLPKPLGRWRMEHCNKKTNGKIDLSNEDHCGQYALEKIELEKIELKNNENINIDLKKLLKTK